MGIEPQADAAPTPGSEDRRRRASSSPGGDVARTRVAGAADLVLEDGTSRPSTASCRRPSRSATTACSARRRRRDAAHRQPGPLLPARRSAHLGIRGPALRRALARELGDRRPRRSGAPRALDAQPGRRRADGQSADRRRRRSRRSSRARTTRRAAATVTRCSCASRSCPGWDGLPARPRTRLTNAGAALNRRAARSIATRSSASSRRRWRRCSRASPASKGSTAFCADEGTALTDFATYARWPSGTARTGGAGPTASGAPTAPTSRAFPPTRRPRASASTPGLQWLLDDQLARASREIAVVHDLPIGLDVAGADAWCWQDLHGARRVGRALPPDEFNANGQDWGLTPFIPVRLRAAHYRPFIETIRAMLRHAGGLRIDHVMGLFRLFWIPRELGAKRRRPTSARAPTSCWRSSRSRACARRRSSSARTWAPSRRACASGWHEQQHAVVSPALLRARAAGAVPRAGAVQRHDPRPADHRRIVDGRGSRGAEAHRPRTPTRRGPRRCATSSGGWASWPTTRRRRRRSRPPTGRWPRPRRASCSPPWTTPSPPPERPNVPGTVANGRTGRSPLPQTLEEIEEMDLPRRICRRPRPSLTKPGDPGIMRAVTRPVPVVVVAVFGAVLVLAAPPAAAAELPPAPPAPSATIVAPLDPPDPGAAPPPAVTAVPETPPVAPPPPPAAPSAADEALRRVLRSSCRDGLDDVRAHRNDPEAPWALTVTRMCNDILIEKMEKRSVTGGNEGRGRLVLWSTLYGIWLGIATDIMFEVDGDRAVIVAPLVGMGAGLGLSLAATSNFHLTVGEAYTIITGLDYGSFNGALWAGGLDLSDKGVVGATVATSIAATSIGVLVANAKSPSAGDIELVRSGLLWGTIGGVLTTAAIGPSITNDISAQSVLKLTAAAMDAGFVTGVALANYYDLSKNRVLLIDAGGFTGGLAGAGIAWLIAGSDSNGQGIAGRRARRHARRHRRRRLRDARSRRGRRGDHRRLAILPIFPIFPIFGAGRVRARQRRALEHRHARRPSRCSTAPAPACSGRRSTRSAASFDAPGPAARRADAGQALGRDPGRRRLAVRAEVGRLPHPRVPRRRRGLPAEPRLEAAGPLLPRARSAAARGAAGARRPRRRDRDRGAGRARLRVAAAAHPPGGVARGAAGARDPGVVRGVGPARARATRTCRPQPLVERRRAAGGGACGRAAARPPDARHARSNAGARLVRALRGRRARRRRRQAPRRHLSAGPARDDEGEARAHRRLRRRRLPLAQGRAGDACSARCCSGSTTTTGVLHHVGIAASFTRQAPRRSWSRSWRRCARTRSRAIRGASGRRSRWRRSGQRMPGATSRWNRGKDLSWEPLRHRAGVRGRLRPPAGRPLPPRDALPPLASRQAARATAATTSWRSAPPRSWRTCSAAAGAN